MAFQVGGVSFSDPMKVEDIKNTLHSPELSFTEGLGKSFYNAYGKSISHLKYMHHSMSLEAYEESQKKTWLNLYHQSELTTYTNNRSVKEPMLTEEEYKKSEFALPNVDAKYGVPLRLAVALYEDKQELEEHRARMNYYSNVAPAGSLIGEMASTFVSPEGIVSMAIGGGLVKAAIPLFALSKSLTKGLGFVSTVGINTGIAATSGIPFYIASGVEDLQGGAEVNKEKIALEAGIFGVLGGGISVLGIGGKFMYNKFFSNEVNNTATATATEQVLNGRKVNTDPIIKKASALTPEEEKSIAMSLNQYYKQAKDKVHLKESEERVSRLGATEDSVVKSLTEEEALDAEITLMLNDKYKNTIEKDLIEDSRKALKEDKTKINALDSEANSYIERQKIISEDIKTKKLTDDGYKIDYERELETLSPENKKSILKAFQVVDKQVDGINKALEEYTKCLIG